MVFAQNKVTESSSGRTQAAAGSIPPLHCRVGQRLGPTAACVPHSVVDTLQLSKQDIQNEHCVWKMREVP